MYVEVVRNRNSPPAVLLRESWREGASVRKRTIANLTKWPSQKVDTLRALLRDETLVRPNDLFVTTQTLAHGHVEAVLGTARKLGLDRMISSSRCREGDLVLAMVVERLLHPCSKLAATQLWETTTLGEDLAVKGTDVDELYDVLDWLRAEQPRIERQLAKRHLSDEAIVLYDVSSSYYYGRTCVLARHGHDRDGKKGLPIIVYGVLTDHDGRPIAVDVYRGNTGDPTTVPDQVTKLRDKFGISNVVLVGDRGMLTQAKIETLRDRPGLGWVSALRSPAIHKLAASGAFQMSLFDERNLLEISSPLYPGERLMVCYNKRLAEERRRKREDLLRCTEVHLDRLKKEVARRTKKPLSRADIGIKAGRLLGRFKMAKHFTLSIGDGRFEWARREEAIEKEASLDGIYVVRTSEPSERLSMQDTVRVYKSLSHVERAFRCMKGLDLLVRPIHHRLEDHVRGHIFLCLLAYYVEWHMRKALAPLLFQDEELDVERRRRDPVARAEPSESVKTKKEERSTTDGLPVQSFKTLLGLLATRCRNTRSLKDHPEATFVDVTQPTALQAKALELLGLVPSTG
jgi:transposase